MVLDSGWYEWGEKHWIENFRFNHARYQRDVLLDDDCILFKPSRDYKSRIVIPSDALPFIMWEIEFARDGQEIIAICIQCDALRAARTIAFTNSERFWVYFMLKYR